MKDKMLVLVGERGTGKSKVQKTLETMYGIKKIITCTTRKPRVGEIQGIDYYFASKESVQNKIDKYDSDMDILYALPIDACGEPMTCLVTTPRGLRFLKHTGIPFFSVYLYVDKPSRLSKLIERGDGIDYAYREIIYDSGAFAGVEEEVDAVVVNPSYKKTVKEITDEIFSLYTGAFSPDTENDHNELKIEFDNNGYIYFKTDAVSAKEAKADFYKALDAAGIITDNMGLNITELVLRDSEFNDLDVIKNP